MDEVDFTVFIPVDEAFDVIPRTTILNLTADDLLLEKVQL